MGLLPFSLEVKTWEVTGCLSSGNSASHYWERFLAGGSSIYPGGGLGGPSCTFFLRGATEALGGGIREAPVQVDPCGKAHKIQPWVILHNV